MKKMLIFLLITILGLTGCSSATDQNSETESNTNLLITIGEEQQTFTVAELQVLPLSEASFKDVNYLGVAIPVLLGAAGVDLNAIKAIKAVAADGYTINYDPSQVLKENVLVAFQLADGSPLTSDDGNFRMVLPDEEGKLNLRMLTELQVIP